MSDECPKCKNSYIVMRDGAGKWIICPVCRTKKFVLEKRMEGAKEFSFENVAGSAAAEIVKKSEANCVVLVAKESDRIILKVARRKGIETRSMEIEAPTGTIAQIRLIIRKAVDVGLLREGDSTIVLADESIGIGFEGMLLFFRIDRKFMELTEAELKKGLKKSVYEAVLEIAKEIGKEGREGRKIGTAFVIGDHENILRLSKQMILNPLEGHQLEKRNITDMEFKETVKALAQLDGAFVLDENGYIHAAGRYLNVETNGIDMPGLGARHLAAAAITKMTSAVAVCVSESGGVVRVFRNGNIVLEEKP